MTLDELRESLMKIEAVTTPKPYGYLVPTKTFRYLESLPQSEREPLSLLSCTRIIENQLMREDQLPIPVDRNLLPI